VTFLRTDVEGSMGLALLHGSAWDGINAAHLDLLRAAVAMNGGVSVRTEGDALFAAFPEAGAAIRSAVDGQRAIAGRSWPGDRPLAVRMGLHTGEAHLAGDDYGGFDVNRVARIAAVAHGGQIVVSGTTQALVEGRLPQGVRIRDLGRHSLKDVPAPEHIFQLEADGLRTEFPPLRVEASTAGNLPDRLTSFVGRDRELDELDRLLDDARLVTLTGPSGIGKTSLAVEVARRHVRRVADGAWLVALDTITDPPLVPAVIARTLGLFDGAEHPAVDALPGFLAPRSTILVLDNFEHLLDAASDVSALVRASPASRVVVTSRAPLRVQGEHEFPVAPLMGERAEGAAADLFADRVRAVRPGWEPGPDAAVVHEICELLDGLPLGIELAAARMAVLPATAIRDRLAAHLPLPGAGPRDAPARQRTLEGAIGWSHDLLDPAAQGAFHQLGVFEGGFDADQAETVVRSANGTPRADLLDVLVALAEQSLLEHRLVEPGVAGRLAGTGIRFWMLKTVQGYALDRLAQDAPDAVGAVRRRHAEAYLDLARQAARVMPGRDQPAWIDRLTLDVANIRAALRWSIDSGDVATALALAGAMWRFWQIDGHLAEGRSWATEALAMPGAEAVTPERLAAVTAMGGIAYWQGERAGAHRWYLEELAIAGQLDDRVGLADAHLNLASTAYLIGDVSEAVEHAHEARRLFVEFGDEIHVNHMDWGLANLRYGLTHPDEETGELLDILRRAEELDDASLVPLAAGSLAWVAYGQGDLLAAGRWVVKGIQASFELRDLASTTIALPMAATVGMAVGRPVDGAVILGAFEALCEQYGVRPPLGLAELIKTAGPMERLQAVLPPEQIAEAMARGRRMSLADAMVLVAELGESLERHDTQTT
jgi:predicted ATPase/class 3 adenylate cyclase